MNRLLLLSVFAGLLLFGTIESYACSCGTPDSKLSLNKQIQKSLKSAEAFSGKVIKIEKASTFAVKVTTKRENVWKGDLPEMTTLITGLGSGDCGFSFETERTYLIYAVGNLKENFLATRICSRTNLLALASKDLEALGKGKVSVRIQ